MCFKNSNINKIINQNNNNYNNKIHFYLNSARRKFYLEKYYVLYPIPYRTLFTKIGTRCRTTIKKFQTYYVRVQQTFHSPSMLLRLISLWACNTRRWSQHPWYRTIKLSNMRGQLTHNWLVIWHVWSGLLSQTNTHFVLFFIEVIIFTKH